MRILDLRHNCWSQRSGLKTSSWSLGQESLPYYYKGNQPLVNFGMPGGAGQPLTERLRKLGGDHDRLWLVQIRPWQTDRQGKVKAVLDEAYALVEHYHFPGVNLYVSGSG